MLNGSSKTHYFIDFWHPFSWFWKPFFLWNHEISFFNFCTFSVGGCGSKPKLYFWKLVLLIKMSTCQHFKTTFKYNLTCIFLSLRAKLKRTLCPRTPCTWLLVRLFFLLKNGILLPKLFWPTVRKNCSTDREFFLKFEAEGSNDNLGPFSFCEFDQVASSYFFLTSEKSRDSTPNSPN